MADAIITLTTDFGEGSPYVAAMKGVILGINPSAHLIDSSHQLPPQDLRHAAFFLASAIPYYPPDCIHVVVVDPGVGSQRELLYVEIDDHRLLVPDNGCWTWIEQRRGGRAHVIRLTEPRFWRQPVSATFHGRDILAPVAAHLSLGIDARLLGLPQTDWVRLVRPMPVIESGKIVGEVLFVDHFGNLITNIPGEMLAPLETSSVHVTVGDHEIERLARTYDDAPVGTLIALVSSACLLEIAINHGNAALLLQVRRGDRVVVETA